MLRFICLFIASIHILAISKIMNMQPFLFSPLVFSLTTSLLILHSIVSYEILVAQTTNVNLVRHLQSVLLLLMINLLNVAIAIFIFLSYTSDQIYSLYDIHPFSYPHDNMYDLVIKLYVVIHLTEFDLNFLNIHR